MKVDYSASDREERREKGSRTSSRRRRLLNAEALGASCQWSPAGRAGVLRFYVICTSVGHTARCYRRTYMTACMYTMS